MSEYIKREEITGLLQSVIDANEDFDTDNSRAQNDVLMWLEEQIPKIPSADVEPVIRCRDCKWLLGEICKRFNLQLDEIRCMEYAPYDNSYCSYGERKDGEEE